jgi:hypothetical protein
MVKFALSSAMPDLNESIHFIQTKTTGLFWVSWLALVDLLHDE